MWWTERCLLEEIQLGIRYTSLKLCWKYHVDSAHILQKPATSADRSSPCKHQLFLIIHHLLIHLLLPSSHPWHPLPPASPPFPSGCGGPAWPWRSFPCQWSWAGGSCRCAAARRSRRRWSSCTGRPASGWTDWWPCLSGWPPATHAGRKGEGEVTHCANASITQSSSRSSRLAKDLQDCLNQWSADGLQKQNELG